MKVPSIKKKELCFFLSSFFPKNKKEYIVFVLFFLIYTSYSLFIVFKTSLIDNPFGADLFFSFDNPQYYSKGYTYIEVHPLVRFVTFFILKTGNMLAGIFYYKIKTLFFALFFTALSSMSCVYILRYLQQVIGINNIKSIILTVFFGFLSTNLILSFTPESFSLTSFFLISMVTYYSIEVKNGKKIPFLIDCFYTIILGGITITNFVKGLIASTFANKINKKLFYKLIFLIILFILILICIPDFVDYIFSLLKTYGPSNSTGQVSHSFDFYVKQIVNFFFGASLLFPNLYVKQDLAFDIMIDMISLDNYDNVLQYIFLIFIYGNIIYVIIKGIKNKLILFIVALVSIDVLIHVIFLYGYTDFFIFGGHWVYAVPLLIGWLYKYIPQKWTRYYTSLLCLLTITLVVNNIFHIVQFIQLGIEYYPA